jgi:hypothetical protein
VEIDIMKLADAPLQKFKWPVAVSRTIEAPPSKIWEVISSPGMLPQFHPFCEKNPVVKWPGPESHDEVHYFNGVLLVRRFTDWYENTGYDLEIGRAGGRTSVVRWRIAQIEERQNAIWIAVYPHAIQRVPIVVRWIPHLMWVEPHLKLYLQSVVKGLEFFITHGKPVQRNQFGSHPWFSPPAEPVEDDGS